MNPELGLAWFRIALFITLISAVLMLVEPRDSAEFIISVTSFIIGLVFIAIVAFIAWRSNR